MKLEPRTQNLVVVADFKTIVNLEKMGESSKVIYEPEQFPGAILRITVPFKASIVVFASGKVVITWLKNSHHINPIIMHLKKLFFQNQ